MFPWDTTTGFTIICATTGSLSHVRHTTIAPDVGDDDIPEQPERPLETAVTSFRVGHGSDHTVSGSPRNPRSAQRALGLF